MREAIYIFLMTVLPIFTFGQTTSYCDTIYTFAEKMPEYPNSTTGLRKYLEKELAPILSECYKRDSSLVSSIYMTLTIDKHGNVTNVVFSRIDAKETCRIELKNKILTMKGWSPAEIDGKKVCCKFIWPIISISWQ